MSSVWEPARTWAFIVGVLEWEHEDIYSPFPKEQRRDAQLVKLLEERGVPKGQIRYLQDRRATTAAITPPVRKVMRRGARLASVKAGETMLAAMLVVSVATAITTMDTIPSHALPPSRVSRATSSTGFQIASP